MSRLKKKNIIFKSKLDFENALDKLATLKLATETYIADYNESRALESKQHKARLKRKNERLVELFAACELYAEHNRETLLADKQTGESKLSLFGFRRSPGIIKTLNSKWTIGKCVEALKAAGPAIAKKCLKTTITLDKPGVKKHLTEEEMAAYGLRLDAPEEFWVEPKRSETPQETRIK